MTQTICNAKGHLTDAAFLLLECGAPERIRLTVTEHLAICPDCAARCADFLLAGELAEPPEAALRQTRRVALRRARAKKEFFIRLAKVAVAAAFTLALYRAGAFSPALYGEGLDKATERSEKLGDAYARAVESFSGKLSQWPEALADVDGLSDTSDSAGEAEAPRSPGKWRTFWRK